MDHMADLGAGVDRLLDRECAWPIILRTLQARLEQSVDPRRAWNCLHQCELQIRPETERARDIELICAAVTEHALAQRRDHRGDHRALAVGGDLSVDIAAL